MGTIQKLGESIAHNVFRWMGSAIFKPEAVLIDATIDAAFDKFDEVVKTAVKVAGVLAIAYFAYSAVCTFKAIRKENGCQGSGSIGNRILRLSCRLQVQSHKKGLVRAYREPCFCAKAYRRKSFNDQWKTSRKNNS